MIYLMRHGNREPDGPEPVRLTELGKAQAARIATALVPRGIVAIYSSPKLRAIETALPLSRKLGLPVEAWPILIEHNSFGPLDYLAAEIAKLGAQLDDRMIVPETPKREEKPFAYKRAELALMEISLRHEERPVAVFAHDCFNSILRWAYFKMGCLEESARIWQGEGCVNIVNRTWLTIPNEKLEAWNA